MVYSFVDEVDKSGTAVPFFSAPEGEEALVIAAKYGNDHAFETLVGRYRRRMLTAALRLARAQEDAEDITQPSAQNAFVHLHTFERRSSFSPWLARITVNGALMLLRRGCGRREMSVDEEALELEEIARLQIPDSDPDPETSYLQLEEALLLSAAMNNLNPALREAVELQELEELSLQETAERTGLSVSAVKGGVLRGGRKLREALTRYVLADAPGASPEIASSGLHESLV
jgi:RNA polymerase sigma-70 factor (ECF subfamily)